MKPSTKKRRRAQRGRPRDENAERTASGRKSRASTPKEDPRMVALTARETHYGVSRAEADNPHLGTALGRLWLSRSITTPMREAGERYLELHTAAMNAIKAPIGLRVSNKAGDGGDVVTEAYEEWAIRAVAHYEAMKAALDDIGCRRSVEHLVIDDHEPASTLFREGISIGLRHLAKKMGLESAA